MMGCGIAALIVLILLVVAVYFGSPAFFIFGGARNFVDYRDAVRGMDIDTATRDQLVDGFENVRWSLDKENNFG